MSAADADRAKAAELLHPGHFTDRIEDVATALAQARAPYDRLAADLRALAEELELAAELYDAAAMDGRIAGDLMAEGGHLIAAGDARRLAARLRAIAAATEGAIR